MISGAMPTFSANAATAAFTGSCQFWALQEVIVAGNDATRPHNRPRPCQIRTDCRRFVVAIDVDPVEHQPGCRCVLKKTH